MPEPRNSFLRSKTSPGSSSLETTCCNWGYGGHGTEDDGPTAPEIAFADPSDNATLAEGLLKYTFAALANERQEDLALVIRAC
jgi:hypothetical protein